MTMTNAKTFTANYKPPLIGAVTYIAFLILMLRDKDMIAFMLLPLAVMLIIGFAMHNLLARYRSISIDEEQVTATTWFGKNVKLFSKEQIKTITIRQSNELTVCEVIATNEQQIDISHFFYTRFYRYENLKGQQNSELFARLLAGLVDSNPQKIAKIVNQQAELTRLSDNFRFLVYPALAVFAGMLYFDMTKIQAIHFNTMNFLLPTIGWIVLMTMLAVLLVKGKSQNKQNLIAGVIVGIVFGWLLASASKSYIHWQNENDPNAKITYYPLLLDDYNKRSEEQRWIVPKELSALIDRETIYIHDDNLKLKQRMNPSLQEGKEYLIPVATGKFNDVFIVKNGFAQVKPVEK